MRRRAAALREGERDMPEGEAGTQRCLRWGWSSGGRRGEAGERGWAKVKGTTF